MNGHVWIDDRGVAWIDDTRTKVIEVVLDQYAHGWSPEEIHFQHPHLSMAQIHSALAYYYDHREGLDAEIDTRYQRTADLKMQAGRQLSRAELQARRDRTIVKTGA